jgi:hypothetical protein
MIKRDKSFKLPKAVKTQMAFISNTKRRNDYKNLMIDAIIKGSILVKNKKQKESSTDETQVN